VAPIDDCAAAAWLRRQLGLITRAQALTAGLTRAQIAHRLRLGVWLRAYPCVFRHVAFPVTNEQRLLAAALAAGPGAAVSHRAAVAVWGLHGYRAPRIEVSRPSPVCLPRATALVHRAPDLVARHVVRRGPLPVTTRARTLVDLGAVASPRLVTRCMEEWLADRHVTIEELRTALDEHGGRGRRGVGVLRAALADRVLGDEVADSGAEALLARVLVERGLPLPEHHHTVRRDGVPFAELDYAYPADRIAIELDGYGVHLRSRTVFEHDRTRQNELEIAGWRVMRFTSRSLRREPGRVADQVRRMLARSPR